MTARPLVSFPVREEVALLAARSLSGRVPDAGGAEDPDALLGPAGAFSLAMVTL